MVFDTVYRDNLRRQAPRVLVWSMIASVQLSCSASSAAIKDHKSYYQSHDKVLKEGGKSSDDTPMRCAKAMVQCPPGMVFISGGRFDMRDENTDGPRWVTLSPYCLEITEVSVAEYERCVHAGACAEAPDHVRWAGLTPAAEQAWSSFCNSGKNGRAEHPQNCITWHAANEYCKWIGGSLPTEAEWEFAARGQKSSPYPWGDAPPTSTRANLCGLECARSLAALGITTEVAYESDDAWPSTAPVLSFDAGCSAFGIRNMAGNVAEWVFDWYAPLGLAPVADPAGPESGQFKVVKGAGWDSYGIDAPRIESRYPNEPDRQSSGFGFRCAAQPIR
jgi:formylglycine-generating enzyme required for sulfatase activity